MANQNTTGWTQERIAAFQRLFDLKKYSFSDIAIKLNEECGTNYSRSAMIGKARRMGLVSSNPVSSAPKKKPAAPVLRCVEVVPLHASAVEVDGCRYPYGDGPFTFCNHPLRAGSSYCVPHHALCWVAPQKTWQRAAA